MPEGDPIDPGPLTPGAARDLTERLRRLEELLRLNAAAPLQLNRNLWQLTVQVLDGFPAEILSGSNPYAWIEKDPSPEGEWVDKVGGRSGTTTVAPAYEFNDDTGAPPGSMVWMWPAALEEDGSRSYTFALNSSGMRFPVRITASDGNEYTFEEITVIGGVITVVEGGRTGIAYELGGNTTVLNGTVVWLSPQGDDYYFSLPEEFIPVKLTERSGTAYSWIEQVAVVGGLWEDKLGGREGELNAFELNSRTDVPVGSYVWLKRRNELDEYGFAYETPDSEECSGYTGSQAFVTSLSFDSGTCVLTYSTKTISVACGLITGIA